MEPIPRKRCREKLRIPRLFPGTAPIPKKQSLRNTENSSAFPMEESHAELSLGMTSSRILAKFPYWASPPPTLAFWISLLFLATISLLFVHFILFQGRPNFYTELALRPSESFEKIFEFLSEPFSQQIAAMVAKGSKQAHDGGH